MLPSLFLSLKGIVFFSTIPFPYYSIIMETLLAWVLFILIYMWYKCGKCCVLYTSSCQSFFLSVLVDQQEEEGIVLCEWQVGTWAFLTPFAQEFPAQTPPTHSNGASHASMSTHCPHKCSCARPFTCCLYGLVTKGLPPSSGPQPEVENPCFTLIR